MVGGVRAEDAQCGLVAEGIARPQEGHVDGFFKSADGADDLAVDGLDRRLGERTLVFAQELVVHGPFTLGHVVHSVVGPLDVADLQGAPGPFVEAPEDLRVQRVDPFSQFVEVHGFFLSRISSGATLTMNSRVRPV